MRTEAMHEEGSSSESTAAPTLHLRGIVKHFGSLLALDNVDFEVRAGEIHALLGENGAGKTTLMNIASGIVRPEAGIIEVRGLPVSIRTPRDAIRNGLGMVHQDFRLVNRFTVAENLQLGWKRGPRAVTRAALRRQAIQLSNEFKIDVDPDAYVFQLSLGERQRVAILRALARGAEILVLDEPTAALTPTETAELFDSIREMAGAGRSIVFISHKLAEVLKIADRISVLRAGRRVATLPVSEADVRALARLMVGHDVAAVIQPDIGSELGHDPTVSTTTGSRAEPRAEKVLVLDNASALNSRGNPALHGISLSVEHGEIVGVAGVSGNGQTELAEVVTGMRPLTSGSIRIDGTDVTHQGAATFIRMGVGHIPDQVEVGLVPSAAVEANAAMKAADQPPIRRGAMISRSQMRSFANDLQVAAGLTTMSGTQRTATLSGGQAQRLLVHRELRAGYRVLVVVHGTRGLDVAATQQVHETLLKAREQGVGILLISEDLDELLVLSDRIIVMFRGQIVGEFNRADADREQLGLLMGGATARRQ